MFGISETRRAETEKQSPPVGIWYDKGKETSCLWQAFTGEKATRKKYKSFSLAWSVCFLFERFSLVSEEEGGDCSRSAMRGNDRADIEHFYLAFEFGELFFERLLRFFGKFGAI